MELHVVHLSGVVQLVQLVQLAQLMLSGTVKPTFFQVETQECLLIRFPCATLLTRFPDFNPFVCELSIYLHT